jgi:hypothetical protein
MTEKDLQEVKRTLDHAGDQAGFVADEFSKIADMSYLDVKNGVVTGADQAVAAARAKYPKMFTGVPNRAGTPPRPAVDRPLSAPAHDQGSARESASTTTARPVPRTRAEAIRFREGDIAKMKVHRTLAELRKPKM